MLVLIVQFVINQINEDYYYYYYYYHTDTPATHTFIHECNEPS